MKALQEIGVKKAVLFVCYSLWRLVFNNLLFPPLRSWWLRLFGATIGKDTIIHQIKLYNLYQKGLSNFSVGDSCFISDTVSFDLTEKITLGDNVNIGQGVIFSTHLKIGYKNHPLQQYFPINKKEIMVENGAFIGVGSIILAGSHIGKYAFITAGTTVSGRILDWTLVTSAVRNRFIPIKNTSKKI